MNYRTDLAIESVEMYRAQFGAASQLGMPEESAQRAQGLKPDSVAGQGDLGEIDGVIMHKVAYDDDITATRIEIVNAKGEEALHKPIGNYITLEVQGIVDEREAIKERAAKALAEELRQLIHFHYHLKVLVVGLGNEKVTPDSLGPHAASKVKITRHLFQIFECEGDEEYGNVAGITPGVTGTTGLETAELIQKVVDMIKPEAVIVVDSLAAKDINRISTTIQIADTGIAPGAGMGNTRKHLNQETLGVKVIAIGVPTVIDSKTLVIDAMSEYDKREDRMKAYLASKDFDMIVTSTDIDLVIKEFSDIIANGINITLHPGIYS